MKETLKSRASDRRRTTETNSKFEYNPVDDKVSDFFPDTPQSAILAILDENYVSNVKEQCGDVNDDNSESAHGLNTGSGLHLDISRNQCCFFYRHSLENVASRKLTFSKIWTVPHMVLHSASEKLELRNFFFFVSDDELAFWRVLIGRLVMKLISVHTKNFLE